MGTSHAAGMGLDTPTPAQLKEFFAQIADKKVPPMRMQQIIRGVGRWDDVAPPPIEQIRMDWEVFYDMHFGMRVDLSRVRIPVHQDDFDRALLIPEGLTLREVGKVCEGLFPCEWCLQPNEVHVPNNERLPVKSYAIRIRETAEADLDMRWVGRDRIESGGIRTMSLLERLTYGLKYYTETGVALDQESQTLCAGSRDSMGLIPVVHWEKSRKDQYDCEIPAKLRVLCTRMDHGDSVIRARAVLQ